MKKLTFLIISTAILIGFPVFAMPQEAAEKSALSWLKLVDDGKYAESWKNAAALFQSKISQDGWAKAAQAARRPLGSLSSRKILDVKLAKSLPGLPDGDYAVIQFSASYAKKADAIEALTLSSDGTEAKVIGYFIR